ncbi:MAG: hypothetical protein ACRDD1_14565 [Planctomycetia bacterium]
MNRGKRTWGTAWAGAVGAAILVGCGNEVPRLTAELEAAKTDASKKGDRIVFYENQVAELEAKVTVLTAVQQEFERLKKNHETLLKSGPKAAVAPKIDDADLEWKPAAPRAAGPDVALTFQLTNKSKAAVVGWRLKVEALDDKGGVKAVASQTGNAIGPGAAVSDEVKFSGVAVEALRGLRPRLEELSVAIDGKTYVGVADRFELKTVK